ncbi:unnamed protein product [Rodentolepis nana]|uniref:MARVEL domain-containing protein n=1 Tax=Rodentolepis nana TaxID=102285 RepID=A0A0R3TBQ1_RODNA|nr:unnamed protein product [Rodentolepis nana]
MDRKIGFALLACLLLLMLILSIGIPKWLCEGNILGYQCIKTYSLRVIGYLLATMTALALLIVIFVLLMIFLGSTWTFIATLTTAGITAVLAMAVTFFLNDIPNPYSSIFAAIGAGIIFGLLVMFLFDYFS